MYKIFRTPVLYATVSIMILNSLAGCGVSTGGKNSFCSIYSPVYTSPEDTEETERQVLENNAVYEEVCND